MTRFDWFSTASHPADAENAVPCRLPAAALRCFILPSRPNDNKNIAVLIALPLGFRRTLDRHCIRQAANSPPDMLDSAEHDAESGRPAAGLGLHTTSRQRQLCVQRLSLGLVSFEYADIVNLYLSWATLTDYQLVLQNSALVMVRRSPGGKIR